MDDYFTKMITSENDTKIEKAKNILRHFYLTDDMLQKFINLFEQSMDLGLGKDTNASAVMKMFPSYVRSVPDGSETGRYLALDLGGTNFRVLLITLSKDKRPDLVNKVYSVPDSVMTGSGTDLFDHIVDSIAKFLESQQISTEAAAPIPLGFTFSFPCKQRGLSVGILEMWTKGFNCSGVVGKNVVELLEQAIERRKTLHVVCVAVLNDTVGTLMSCAYEDRSCLIGLILGTGTNACYMENLDRVQLWDEDMNEPKQVIINTEWCALGGDGALDFLRTEFDWAVDEGSLNAGKHIFEKMVGGMYLGEIVRLAMVKLANEQLLFQGHVSEALNTQYNFDTKLVSDVESDVGDAWENTRRVLNKLGVNASIEDCSMVKVVCELVSQRAAHLASAGVAALLNRMSRPHVTVGVDGSLYKFHPKFSDIMQKKVQELVNEGIGFKLMESHDGSGKGAALVAAVAQRMRTCNTS